MELLCPHCQKNLSIAESYAGQLVRCPTCAATFTAPALPPGAAPPPNIAPTPPAPAPPEPPLHLPQVESEPEPAVFIFPDESDEPALTTTPSKPTPPRSGPAEGFALAPEPFVSPPRPGAPLTVAAPEPSSVTPPSVGPLPSTAPIDETLSAPQDASAGKAPSKTEYAHGFTLYFRRDAAAWIAPLGLFLLFFLSFFPWESTPSLHTFNLWQLAFSEHQTSFILYLVFFFLAWPLSIAAFLLQKKLLATPPGLKGFLPWSSLLLAGLTLLPFLMFLTRYLYNNFYGFSNPSTAWMKIAFRVHFLVVAGALLHFWLVRRSARKMPDPRIVMRW